MSEKYEVRRRSSLSGTPVEQPNEGCWLDGSRSLEQTDEADEAEARWCFWIESYEMTVLLEERWLLAAGWEEEGI